MKVLEPGYCAGGGAGVSPPNQTKGVGQDHLRNDERGPDPNALIL